MFIFLKTILVLEMIVSLFGEKYSLRSVEAGILRAQILKNANGQTGNKRDIEKENTKMYHLMAQHIGPNEESKDLNVKYPNYDILEFDEKKIDSLKQIKNVSETTSIANSPYTTLNKRRSIRTNLNKALSFERNSIVAVEKTDPFVLKSEFDSSFRSSKPREVFKHRRQALKLNHRKLYGPQKIIDSRKRDYNPQQLMSGTIPWNADFPNNMVISKTEPSSTQRNIKKVPENFTITEENESKSEEDTETTSVELSTQLYASPSDRNPNGQYPFTADIHLTKNILEPLTESNESAENSTDEMPFSNSSEIEFSTQNPYDGYIKAGPIRIKISNDTSPHKLKMRIRPDSNTNLTFRIERQSGQTFRDSGSEVKNIEKKDVAEKTIENNNVQFERDIYKPDNMNDSVNLNASAAMSPDSYDISKMAFPLWQLSKDSNGQVRWDLRRNSEKSKYIEISNQQLNDDSELESNIIYVTDSYGHPKLKVSSYSCKTLILNIFKKHTVASVVLLL